MRRPARPWTAQDDALLRKFHAEGKIDSDLVYIMDRPHSVIWRHRTDMGLKPNGTPGAKKGGFKHTDEGKAKISAFMRKRWQEDPAYRQRTVDALQRARDGSQARRWHVPTEPTMRRYYFKVRALYGAKFARSAISELSSAAASLAE